MSVFEPTVVKLVVENALRNEAGLKKEFLGSWEKLVSNYFGFELFLNLF